MAVMSENQVAMSSREADILWKGVVGIFGKGRQLLRFSSTFSREQQQERVDVQVGSELMCSVPPEMRQRLWAALLADPTLQPCRASQPAPSPVPSPAPSPPPSTSSSHALTPQPNPHSGRRPTALTLDARMDSDPFDPSDPSPGSEVGLLSAFLDTSAEQARRQGEAEGEASAAARGASSSAQPSPGTSQPPSFSGELPSEQVQRLLRHMLLGLHAGSRLSELEQQAQAQLVQAMLDAAWSIQTPGAGPPPAPDRTSRFAVLVEITTGQEDVDAQIERDLHRTFPEHPLFGCSSRQAVQGGGSGASSSGRTRGQESLFRVLKAYSVHDLEVSYCQGLAFLAGVLLMYLDEEPAFRLFCRLMDPQGPNLRRMYLPGLDGVRDKLAQFDILCQARQPALQQHLRHHDVVPVMFLSQWLMTGFSNPFGPGFCALVIDVLLQDGNDGILLRLALVLMEELEGELMQHLDFEELLLVIKTAPGRWDMVKQRMLLERALHSTVSDTDLLDALDHAARETTPRARHAVLLSRKVLRASATPQRPPTAEAAEAGGDSSPAWEAPDLITFGAASSFLELGLDDAEGFERSVESFVFGTPPRRKLQHS